METQQRGAAVRSRLREIKIAEDAAEQSGPPCSQCIFGPLDGDPKGKCDHIAHWERRHDPVIGKWKGWLAVTVADARSPDGLCGPEALLFEPYTLPQKAARWLARNGPFPLWLGAIGALGGAAALIEALSQ